MVLLRENSLVLVIEDVVMEIFFRKEVALVEMAVIKVYLLVVAKVNLAILVGTDIKIVLLVRIVV